MSLRYLEDVALLSQPKPTAQEGVESLIKFMQDGTTEVKNIMKNECNIIMECRYCRNMFRSVSSLITHKRTYCRGQHQVAVANAEAARKLVEAEIEKVEKEQRERDKDNKKNPGSFRRVNIVGALNKRATDIEIPVPECSQNLMLHTLPKICREMPVTVFEDGQQKVLDIPATLAQKESVPEDRVVLVIPQDHSSKYREMQLRHRKDQAAKQESSRAITNDEVGMLDRCEEQCSYVDVGSLRCLHPYCKNLRSFGSIQTLVYHISIKHLKLVNSDNTIQCLVCGKELKFIANLQRHMKLAHRPVIEEHEAFRAKEAETEKRKPGRKSQADSHRYRSMSPVRDTDEANEIEILERQDRKMDGDGEEADDNNSPPPSINAVEPLDMDDGSQDSIATEDDEPPELVRMHNNSTSRRNTKIPQKYRDNFESASTTPKAESLKRESPSPSEKKTESLSGGSRDLSLERDIARIAAAERRVAKETARAERKLIKDVARSVEFLVAKTVEGELQARLDDLSSREPSSIPSSGRQTPIAPLLLSFSQPESASAGIIPPLKRAHSLDLNAAVEKIHKRKMLANTNTNRSSVPVVKSNLRGSASVLKKSAEKKPKRGRPRKNPATAVEDESDEEVEVKLEEDELEEEDDQQLDGGVEEEDDDMTDDSPVSRPSRTRKRPDWMGEDYILDKGTTKYRKNQKRDDEVSPTPSEAEFSQEVKPPSGSKAATISDNIAAKKLQTNFTIPRKRILETPEKKKSSPVKRRLIQGPPLLSPATLDSSASSLSRPAVYGSQAPVKLAATKKSISGQIIGISGAHKVWKSTAAAAPGPSTSSAVPVVSSIRTYTPRARRLQTGDGDVAGPSDGGALDTQPIDSPEASTSSRRKQNLTAARGLTEDEEATLVSANGKVEQPSGDLAQVPVFLSQLEKETFFSALVPKEGVKWDLSSESMASTPFVCQHCNVEVPNLRDGRRHMVSHIRVMRLRCKLCGAGAFFCSDMRDHLTERGCPNLHLAPSYIHVMPDTPCMKRSDADALTEIVDRVHPGRVMYTSGQIVSTTSITPYFPDPVIEERILGAGRVAGRSSPFKAKNRFQQGGLVTGRSGVSGGVLPRRLI